MQMQQHIDSAAFTPDSFAVDRLEAISQDIMLNYPELLQEAISDILEPLHKDHSITYDLFSSVAKTVYNIKLPKVSETVWSRVALVLYMVKETMFLGNLNDTQLEVLVEHSAKFMFDNVNETVKKEGGWVCLLLFYLLKKFEDSNLHTQKFWNDAFTRYNDIAESCFYESNE